MAYTVIAATVFLSSHCYVSAVMIEGREMSIDDAIIKATSNYSLFNVRDENTVLVELDILYKKETYDRMVKTMVPIDGHDLKRTKRKAIRAEQRRWTNQRIPYEISREFSSRDTSAVNAAINDYHKYTCLKFEPATSNDRNKIRFQNGTGCSSHVGMVGNTQPVNLARGCRYKGVIIHEMGHIVGFYHEQSRADRDNYVQINSANIKNGNEINFMKHSTGNVNNYGVPYDYTSVMHYSGTAFSKNGQPTIIARNRRYQRAMGNRDGLSYRDIQLANAMYNCSKVNGCLAKQCAQGFQGPDCECWCDSGDTLNPIKQCSGGITTFPTTTPSTCKDKSSFCPKLVQEGYCTGQYERFMRENCANSCDTCEEKTQ